MFAKNFMIAIRFDRNVTPVEAQLTETLSKMPCVDSSHENDSLTIAMLFCGPKISMGGTLVCYELPLGGFTQEDLDKSIAMLTRFCESRIKEGDHISIGGDDADAPVVISAHISVDGNTPFNWGDDADTDRELAANPVAEAFLHVMKAHPNVTQVFYGTDGRWLYCGDSFESPVFGNEIDISLLEDAVDSLSTLPAAFGLHQFVK